MKYLNTIMLMLFINMTMAQNFLGSEFTYQGNLELSGNPANGLFDFKFVVFDTQADGTGVNYGDVVVEDVNVIEGIFTTQIDLGSAVFSGEKIWMEINVRLGAETGDFQLLSPRQQITSTPYAIHAQFVGADAITGIEILDQSITTDDLANNSITSIKIIDGSVGATKIVSTEVQKRISNACPIGQFINMVDEDGVAFCQADQTGLTTITSAEIVDGTIATIDLADDSINNAKIANAAIGATEIISSQVQRRIISSCESGYYLNGINEDGSIQCQRLPIGLDFVADNSDTVGAESSIAFKLDGNAIISYFDQTNGDLKLFNCSNSTCSSGSTYTLDTIGVVGSYTSIAVKSNGYAIISYLDQTNEDLKVFSCSNIECSAGTATTLDSTGIVGYSSSIAIKADGNAIISYRDASNTSLKVYNCTNTNCTTGTAYTLDSIGNVGISTSIAIRSNGNPIISYGDADNYDLKVFSCSNSICSTGSSYLVSGAGGFEAGYHTSIAIRSNGNPIISNIGWGSGNVMVHSCDNSNCSSGLDVILETLGGVSFYTGTSIALKADGNPIISYYDRNTRDLKIFSCSVSNCLSGGIRILDSMGDVGHFPSIATKSDGTVLISYQDLTNGDLKVYSCGDQNCAR